MRCKKCGTCCKWDGYVHIQDEDIKKIASFLNISEQDFINTYTELTKNRQGLSLVSKNNGDCVFLNDDKCAIYSVRPRQCKDFPFLWKLIDMDGCGFYK